MKFAEYTSWLDVQRQKKGLPKDVTFNDYYRQLTERHWAEHDKGAENELEVFRHLNEWEWYSACRPYYKVWPAINEMVQGANLNINLSQVPHAGPLTICIRTPELCFLVRRHTTETGTVLHFLSSLDDDKKQIDSYITNSASQPHHQSLEEASAEYDAQGNPEFRLFSRLYVGIQLLANDPEFIQPDVLNRDKEKFARTGDPKHIEKAKRNGKFGWNVGEHLESIPHFRRPHFGIRWMKQDGDEKGEGKLVPRLRPIKGAVVHRDKLRRVPTGYITPEGVEVEPS